MEPFECDVVIIGAGLSGLSAAFHLVRKDRGLRIAILEAKDRLGGRTLTKQLVAADGTRDFWDLGGEWVGRPQPHLHYLLGKFHINTFNPVSPKDGKNVIEIPALSWRIRMDLTQFIWKLKQLQKRVNAQDLKNNASAFQWDSISFESYKADNLWTEGAKEVVDSACRCMFGLSPSEMSLLYFLKYIKPAGGLKVFIQPKEFTGGECRIKGGVQQLAYHMAHMIGRKHVYLNQPVTQIIQSIEGAHVFTDSGLKILCQRVIMAIPPHHGAAINYQPPLPAVKLGLLQSIPLAFLVKFAATYEEAFWEKKSGSQQYGFQDVLVDKRHGPVGIVYNSSSARGNPSLSGFISCYEGLDADPKLRKSTILGLIENLVGLESHKVLEFSQKDWSMEPYNGGCFLKSLLPGVTKFLNSELREPFDRVHFAGTETATIWCGFMNGAVQSGFRAATEVLYHLRPFIVSSPDPELSLPDEEWGREEKLFSLLTWTAAGVGVASVAYLAYLVMKTRTLSTPTEIFVRNIRLVFEP